MDHYPLEDRYLSRNPHIAPPAVEVSIPAGSDPNRLYPIGELTLFKMSGPPGRPTAACGLEVYRDELLGADFANNVFVAEPVNRLIHRRQLAPHGATFDGIRAADESNVDFLASTDPWFRPVQVRTGLDGCLYVVDMHREVIEHKKFIPEEELEGLNLTAGREQGRIYRIRPTNVAATRADARLDELDAKALAAAIDSPNGPQRDWIQQTLVQRRAKEAVPGLIAVFRQSSRPAARLQALCTLDGLQALDGELLVAALADARSVSSSPCDSAQRAAAGDRRRCFRRRTAARRRRRSAGSTAVGVHARNFDRSARAGGTGSDCRAQQR